MSSDTLSADRLGENGLAFAMVALMMGTLAVIAACPWLGLRLLILRCRLGEPGARRTWTAWAVLVAVALAWAGSVGWLGYRLANATCVMTARLDFDALPPSDEALTEWLRSQPGVVAADVRRQGNTVVVECTSSAHRTCSFGRWGDTVVIEVAALTGGRHTLPLSRVAAASGYGGLRQVEFDAPRRHW